ncbi:MAG: ABC transporter permease [Candidatus Acidiferrales bacterium]
MWSDLKIRLRALFRRKSVETEMDDELRFHFERRVETLVQAGVPRDEAARRARMAFGGGEQIKEECREARGIDFLETLWQDIRYGLRTMRRSPGFTIVAVLTLALGIGATTAIFSVVSPLVLEPLPFRDPSQLVTVLETNKGQGLDWLTVTPSNFLEWQRRSTAFESLAGFYGCGYRLAEEGVPEFLNGRCVSSSFFPMLGVQPILGRLWSASEDWQGQDHVALLSYNTWKQQFGGDPSAIGKTIWRAEDRQVFTIIGVLPQDFQFSDPNYAVWTPLDIGPDTASVHYHNWMVMARLKPGVTVPQAQSSMDAIATQLEQEFPTTNKGWGVTVQPLQRFYSNRRNARTTLLLLLASVAGLLLIASANVANLLLARAAARHKEISVRVALGATRMRLVRQFLTESVLLGLAGGAAGFLLAWAGFSTLVVMLPRMASFRPNAVRIDAHVFLFAMAASFLVSVLFGLAPSMRVSRQGLGEGLRKAGRGGGHSVRDAFVRHALVVGQIGVVVVLLIGTALLVESLRNLENDRLGFTPDHVLTMGFCCLDSTLYTTQPQFSSFYKRLLDNLNSLPGVIDASITSGLPTRQFDGAGSPFLIQGRPAPEPGHPILTDSRFVGADYFSTMKIPVMRGRAFTAEDDDTHPLVALINQAMAQRYWQGADPIGQQIQLVNLPPLGRWFTVVGIAADSRERGAGQQVRSMVYIDYAQNMSIGGALLIRTAADPHLLIAPVRDALHSMDQNLSVDTPQTYDEVLAQSLTPERFSVSLLTLFTIFALILACVGVYGVTAYAVAQRTHEIGVRIALGARRRDVMMMVLGQGLRLAAAGVAIGLVCALGLMRLLSGLLFGVSARDPFTILGVCGALVGVSLLACYIPARRAMNVDPMEALRYE